MPKLDWQRFIWPVVIVGSIAILVIAIAESNRNNRGLEHKNLELVIVIENQDAMLSSQHVDLVNANDDMAVLQEHHRNELKLVSSIVDQLPKCKPVAPFPKRSAKSK